VAPILLADPSANITAVWLGVMIGLNIQTSFLTPPFGFALFYLRGVAPKSVKTTDIYKGAVAFIALQLFGLGIAAAFPSLINYLPNRVHLTSETAPPPNNPRLQLCLEQNVFEDYDNRKEEILAAVDRLRQTDYAWLPENYRSALDESLDGMSRVFDRVAEIRRAEQAVNDYAGEYKPLHDSVRRSQRTLHRIDREIEELEDRIEVLQEADEPDQRRIERLQSRIVDLKAEQRTLQQQIPEQWEEALDRYKSLTAAEKKARNRYRRQVDDSYQTLLDLRAMIAAAPDLERLKPEIEGLHQVVREQPIDEAMAEIKRLESALSGIKNAHTVKSKLSKARRALKKKQDRDQAAGWIVKAIEALDQEMAWRNRARQELLPELERLDAVVAGNIGLRLQQRLSIDQAEAIAACKSHHKDVSLAF
jgi:chromosome segregation ATPase